jgi:hypothetical protein
MRASRVRSATRRLASLQSLVTQPDGIFARHLIIVIGLASVGCALLSSYLAQRFLVGFWHSLAVLASAAFLFFALGWIGIIIILRKEYFYVLPNPIRGRPAVLAGAITTSLCWIISLWSLFRLVLLLIRPEVVVP